jgi:hypothetical protein
LGRWRSERLRAKKCKSSSVVLVLRVRQRARYLVAFMADFRCLLLPALWAQMTS